MKNINGGVAPFLQEKKLFVLSKNPIKAVFRIKKCTLKNNFFEIRPFGVEFLRFGRDR